MKLVQSALPRLPPAVRTPRYARGAPQATIVHVGVGGFFRSHQAVYLDDLLQRRGQADWAYRGVGLLPGDARMAAVLASQDYLYSVLQRSARGDRVRVIGSLHDFLHAPAGPDAVLEAMASPACRIVSLTITEGGYCLDPGSGRIDPAHPDLAQDRSAPQAPRSTFAYLAQALARRRVRGIPPFTVMSCDNLPGNGDVARDALLAFARHRHPALAEWIERHGAFPNSMVDRITPATSDDHRRLLADCHGIEDAWPVVAEPFRQWVLEDRFVAGRPGWEEAGVQMAADVRPYEKLKLRLLNGGHQALCYIGLLLGYRYVDEAVDDPCIALLLERLMEEEIGPLLDPVPGVDLPTYRAGLLERFGNTAIRDELARIAVDGSQRMPKFVLPSIAEQAARGAPLRRLGFVVACWFRFLAGRDRRGRELALVDPLAAELRRRALQGGPDPGPLLSTPGLFGTLPGNPAFVSAVEAGLGDLYRRGPEIALLHALAD